MFIHADSQFSQVLDWNQHLGLPSLGHLPWSCGLRGSWYDAHCCWRGAFAFLSVWMTRPYSTVEKCTTEMACQTRHLQAFEKLKTGVSQRSAVKGL